MPPAPEASHPADRWARAVTDRIRTVSTDGAHKVVYFYESPDTSTFRYRVANMLEALASGGGARDVAATYFTESELPILERLIGTIDTLVICRARYTSTLDGLVSRARGAGCRVLFDVDDLVFDTRYATLVMETLDQSTAGPLWDFWFAYISRIGALLRLCDGATATNRFLADRIEDFAQLPAAVVPNFLNADQLKVSAEIMRTRRGAGNVDRVGYFSGTPTHNRDFELVAPALARVMTRHTRMRLSIVGFLDVGRFLHGLEDRVDVLPLTDFLTLQTLVAGSDLNIVPLQVNTFTNSKSELKYFEAAIVGTPTLATPTSAYRAAIVDGDNGYLVDACDWEERLEQAASGALDLAGVSARGREHAERTYAPPAQVDAIRRAVLPQ